MVKLSIIISLTINTVTIIVLYSSYSPLKTMQVGTDDDGKIQYLNVTIIQDTGCATNDDVVEYTTAAFPNCYNTETWTLKTANVLTDLPCNTFARGSGKRLSNYIFTC